MLKPTNATDPIARRNRRAACSRWHAFGCAIPHDTTDLRLAIKREIWTRGLTLNYVNQRLGFSPNYINNLLSMDTSGHGTLRRITPSVLARIIGFLHIPAKTARRLHELGAVADGWDIDGSRARTKNEALSAPVPLTHSQASARRIQRLTP